jgi:hypothetical protein
MNTIIKQYRESTNSSSEPNRTRPMTEFECGVCKTVNTIRSSSYKEDKPCRSCQKREIGKRNLIKRNKEKFGDKFDISKALEEYVDYKTPVTVTCLIHNHSYKISPTHFTAHSYDNAPHKGGCSMCAVEASKKYLNKPIDHYLKHLNDKWPNIKVATLPENTNSNLNKIELECPHHGKFTTTLARLVSGDPNKSKLCPSCSKELLAWNTRTVRTDVKGKVYFVKFKNENLYKCGVTYQTVNTRFKGYLSQIEILWEIEFDTLEEAYIVETAIFRKYKHLRTNFPDTSFGGYTEFLTEFIEKPDKRFIEEILCRKESNSGEILPSNVEDNPERSLDNHQETCRD